MYQKVFSATLRGINGLVTEVEADSSNGLPSFSMVGNLSPSVKEAGDRVRTALKNSEIEIPAKKVTINIVPADIRKDGTNFDLPIAIAILKSLEIIDLSFLDDYAFLGELNLNGDIVGVRGVLSMVTSLKEANIKGVFIPKVNEKEALIVEGIDIIPVSSIKELISIISDENSFKNFKRPTLDKSFLIKKNSYQVDFSDVNGQKYLKRAIEVAVAGFHNIIISGPAGTGKTMIAKRIPTIMPDLTIDEAIEITKVYSIAGLLNEDNNIILNRPFRSPHHSISLTSLIGGGVYPRPGEISLASNGVLFLDELPLFQKNTIETLREPLEDKQITVTRLQGAFSYPANFMLVAAMNPCPCGYYPDRNKCNCSIVAIDRYQKSISKPILERIDICAESASLKFNELVTTEQNEKSEEIKKRIVKAREMQKERFKNYKKINFNSQMGSKEVKKFCAINEDDYEYLKKIFYMNKLSARTYHKILKVSRTIADLEGCEDIKKEHLVEACSYRKLEEKLYG